MNESVDARVACFVNKKIPNSVWRTKVLTDLVCILEFTWDDHHKILANVYQPPFDDRTEAIEEVFTQAGTWANTDITIVGDFNAHHRSWSPLDLDEYHRGRLLYTLATELHLGQALPPGTITREGSALPERRSSTIDLVFTNAAVGDCRPIEATIGLSDQSPIFTSLTGRGPPVEQPREVLDWSKVDRVKLQQILDSTPAMPTIETPEESDSYTKVVIDHMQQATEEAVGKRTITPGRSRKGWPPGATEVRRRTRQLRRQMKSGRGRNNHRVGEHQDLETSYPIVG